eukprot:8767140-Lingulodinium_polyedra.AAC.1
MGTATPRRPWPSRTLQPRWTRQPARRPWTTQPAPRPPEEAQTPGSSRTTGRFRPSLQYSSGAERAPRRTAR